MSPTDLTSAQTPIPRRPRDPGDEFFRALAETVPALLWAADPAGREDYADYSRFTAATGAPTIRAAPLLTNRHPRPEGVPHR